MLCSRKTVHIPFLQLVYLTVLHILRGIHDLKPYNSTEEYEHIMEFFYLDSEAKVEEFKEWVRGLKNPKVQGTIYIFRCFPRLIFG